MKYSSERIAWERGGARMAKQKLPFHIEITNIVATSAVNFFININRFAQRNDYTIDERYPVGVHCRDKHIVGLVTVYRTGKMITVGAKSERQAKRNLKYIISLLKNQRKQIEIRGN